MHSTDYAWQNAMKPLRNETRKTKRKICFNIYKSTFSPKYICKKQILIYFVLLSIQEWMVPKMNERCSNYCTNTLGGCLVLTEMIISYNRMQDRFNSYINVAILLVRHWVFTRPWLRQIAEPKNASKKCWKYLITFLLCTRCSLHARYYILHASTVKYTGTSSVLAFASIKCYVRILIYSLRSVNVSCLYQLVLRVPFDTA